MRRVNLDGYSSSPAGPASGHYVSRLPAPHVLWGRTDELRCATFWCDKGLKQRMSGRSFWMRQTIQVYSHYNKTLWLFSAGSGSVATDSSLKEYTGRLVCSSPSFVSFKVVLFAHFEMYLLGAPGFPPKKDFQRSDHIFSRPHDDIEAEPFFRTLKFTLIVQVVKYYLLFPWN